MAVPSLTELCLDSIKKSTYFRSTEGLLSIYATLDSGNPTYFATREYAVRSIQERYPMLLEKYGLEEMKLIFDSHDLERFETARLKNLEVKKVFSSLKGTVIEPLNNSTKIRADGTYPIEALLQGCAWPEGIDTSKREQYLSEEDFIQVFGMTKQEFNNKDKFVRLRLKKENRLF